MKKLPPPNSEPVSAKPAVSRSLWILCGLASVIIWTATAYLYFTTPPGDSTTTNLVWLVAGGAVPLAAALVMTILQDIGHSVRHTAVDILREARKDDDR
jgi:hypothetical protein